MNHVLDTTESPQRLFHAIQWKRLILGFFVTAILALSVHAVMLQVLHVPYPSEPMTARVPHVINDMVMLWAAIWLATCLRRRPARPSAVVRIGVLLLLLCCLNETLRGWFMNGYCTNSPHAFAYFAIGQLPRVVPYAVIAVIAVPASAYLHKWWQQALGAALLGLLLSFALPPFSAWIDTAIVARFADWAPTEGWCQLPYGWDVLIPAYLTFIVEPAVACLFCMAYASRGLNGRPWVRAVMFMLLILALKRQLLTAIFYTIYTPLPPMTALGSMGQFSLEAAVLGFLMAFSWRYASACDSYEAVR
jgi:hypothetical protein